MVTDKINFVVATEDKEEYERFKTIVGQNSTEKRMIYIDPETDKVEGIEDLVKEIVPKENPILQYYNQLEGFYGMINLFEDLSML